MEPKTRGREVIPKFHYAWVIALTGMAVLFSCLGLGRFALGMLLPSMGTSLNLNYSQMGLIGTGNFVGYMISVVLAGMIARSMGARKTIFLGLILVGGSMVWISRATGYMEILVLYLATGIGSGLANVPLMGLVSHWFLKSNRGRAAGTMLSGNGIAIVFTGIFIPWINALMGKEGWRTGWLIFGIISIFIAAMAGLFLRNDPREKGLAPLGETGRDPLPLNPDSGKEKERHRWTMVHLGCIYSLFGATYVVYATFIVTAMVKEMGFGENTAGNFWAVVGALSIFSGPLFGGLSDKLGRRAGIMIVYGLFTLSYILVAADLPQGFLYASIGIFGLAVWSIPTIMSAAVGDYAGPEQAVKAFGFITLFFGAGQITGPAVAGILADLTGTFSTAFWLCAVLTGSALVMAYFLRPPSDSNT
ncbi:MFS transporter [Desulfospira joergensenii]|uniref:MFS transporter n=1 Tax=Desulfospira joergensenii TaxID=53329 RepID=UPI0003B43CA4|nr:MFS transporter [Desulfospira joergensenii]